MDSTGSRTRTSARLPAWPAWLYLAFLAYGSLVPLDFHANSLQYAWSAFKAMPWTVNGRFSLTDALTNVALYVSLPMLWLSALRQPASGNGAIAVWLGCLAVSASVEFAQSFTASRTPLLGDIVTNGLGAAIGILLWPIAGPRLTVLSATLSSQSGRTCPVAPAARLPAALGLLPYLGVLAWRSGWFESAWLPPDAALSRLSEMHLTPFYQHYFADIGFALRSVITVTAAFVPLGAAVWALRGRPAGARELLRRAAFWSVPLAVLLESGKLFMADRQPDYTNLLFAALGSMLGCLLACWYSTSIRTTAAVATTAPAVGRQARLRVGWPLLSGAALLLSLVGLWHQPFARIPLTVGALLYFALLLRYPHAWLVVVPALLPVLDLAPWSGRFFFDEFDLLLLITLAAGYGRSYGMTRGTLRLPPGLKFLLGLFMASCLISLAAAIFPLAPLDLNSFSHYYSPYNALRVAKGFFWALVLLPLLLGQLQAGAPVGRLFTLGMTIGLAGEVLAIVWERAVFSGLTDFTRDFRVAGLMSSMHTGGSHLEAYLALALPFLAASAVGRRGWGPPLLGMALLLGGLYALAVTYARGGYAAMLVALLVLAVGWVIRGSQSATRRATPYVIVATVLAGLIVAPILGGQFAQYRLAKTGGDAQVRLTHWREALEMRDRDWWTELFGMGPGSFPAAYFYRSPPGARPASFGYIEHDGQRALALGSGTPLYVEQKVPVRHDVGYRLDVTARSVSGNGKLNVLLCERTYFDAFGCASSSFALTDEWLAYGDRLTLDWPVHRGRPVTLSLEVASPGSVVQIRRIALLEPAGRDVIRNGDFSRGADHWYFSVFDHLPWHIKNLWVDLLFSQGWMGLIAFALFAGYGLIQIARRFLATGDMFSLSALAGLAGFLTVSVVDSLFDAPRLTLLFFLTLLAGTLRPGIPIRPTPRPVAQGTPKERGAPASDMAVHAAESPARSGETMPARMPAFWRDLAVGLGVVAALGLAVTHIPGVPYNVRELVYQGSPAVSALLLALFWFWFAGMPVLIARGLAVHPGYRWGYPLIVSSHTAVASLLLVMAVPSESLHDVVGSPVLGWPWQLESLARLMAIFAAASLLLTGGAWVSRTLVTRRGAPGITTLALAAVPVLTLTHWVVVERASTDNLTELMAGGGSLHSSAAMTAWALLVATAGSLLGRFAAGRGLRPAATLLWITLALPLSYGLAVLGTEATVFKYGQRFSALQFLLSADRSHLTSDTELLLRYAVACLGCMLALAFAQRPFFKLTATQRSHNRSHKC
jgi:VanZ family protein